jgi:hypothetical protein
VFEERREAALKAMDDAGRELAAKAAATSGYWLAELAARGGSLTAPPA